jgi:hypothetical protein
MNLFDGVIVILLFGIFAAVFIGGLGRAFAALLALWLGLIGADVFGAMVGRLLHRVIPSVEVWTAHVLGFFIALIVVVSVVMYLLLRSFRTLSSRSGIRFDVRGGIPALLATIVLAGVLALASVTVVVQAAGYAIDQTPRSEVPGFVARQYYQASLRPGAQRIAGYVYEATGSWVPGGTPSVIAREN